MPSRIRLTLFFLALLPLTAWPLAIQPTDAGLRIDAGAMGTFTLGYPVLLDKADAVAHKPIERKTAGAAATVKYDGGGQIDLTVNAGTGEVTLAFSNMPADVAKYRMDMLIGFEYSEGGTWKIGDADAKAFPKAKPAKPFLYQGNNSALTLADAQGHTLAFALPEFAYQQLQDNREWNWKTFAWQFLATYQADHKTRTLRISDGTAAGGIKRVITVDRYGQDQALDFPEKVKSDEELTGDLARDTAYYAGLTPPATDQYGGLPGSREALKLQQTGYFHVEQAGKRWVMVDPDGNAYFHLGLCAFGPGDDYTYIKGRESLFAWLPGYDGEFHTAFHPAKYWSRDAFSFYLANVIRKYGKPYDREEWTARMIPRVRKLGFNAAGAFSGPTTAHADAHFPYVLTLPLGQWTLGRQIPGLHGLFDPFDEVTAIRIETLFAREVAPAAKEPLLIGYFLDNEQAFEDIPRVIPALKATQPAKVRLVKMLLEEYRAIDAFNAAWGMKADGFDALLDMGLPVTTKAAAKDVRTFTGLYLEAYYRLIAETFHRYDAHHLLIGNRWQPGTANNEQLCRIAGQYLTW